MKSTSANLQKVSIHVGGVYTSRSPVVVRTVLGSCIAICLFDPVSFIGGKNHFMLPSGGGDAGLPTRFGVYAMEMLINQLMQLGADRQRLQAKMFGGTNVLDLQGSHLKVAEKNRRFAREFLETEGIPLVAQHVGGVEPLAPPGCMLLRADLEQCLLFCCFSLSI